MQPCDQPSDTIGDHLCSTQCMYMYLYCKKVHTLSAPALWACSRVFFGYAQMISRFLLFTLFLAIFSFDPVHRGQNETGKTQAREYEPVLGLPEEISQHIQAFQETDTGCRWRYHDDNFIGALSCTHP